MTVLSGVLWLLLLSSVASATPFSNCGFTGALLGVQVGDCDHLPCVIKRGSTVPMQVRFKAVQEIVSMKSMIFGLLDNIPIPLSYDNQMCNQMLAGRCPAKAGQELTYAMDLPVAADMPAVGITLEWHITDQHDATVLCALVPAQFT